MSDTTANSNVIERLKKLLAVAKDSRGNEHEAEVAMGLAQKLMNEHNLSMAQIESDTGTGAANRQKVEDNSKALYQYQRDLMGAVAAANFCYHWIGYDYKTTMTGYRKAPKHMLVGREVNVIAARNMFDYLCSTIERLVPVAENSSRLSKSAISWKEGCAARLIQRLRVRRAEMEAEQRAKAEAARPTQSHSGTPGTGLVVSLTAVYAQEWDANYEFAHGYEPGYMAKMRAEREARMAAAADAPKVEGKTETAAERKAREAAEARSRKYWEREERRQQKRWNSKDHDAYFAGSEAGKTIGLDTQIAQEAAKARLK